MLTTKPNQTTPDFTSNAFESFLEAFTTAIYDNHSTIQLCEAVNYDYDSCSLEMQEKIKMCIHDTQKAYNDSPCDDDGLNYQQELVTDAIIWDGAKELYQIMYF